jgi:hypothetical protein
MNGQFCRPTLFGKAPNPLFGVAAGLVPSRLPVQAPRLTRATRRAKSRTASLCFVSVLVRGSSNSAACCSGENPKRSRTAGIDLSAIKNIVAVHRLREVSCLYGFTRFEAAPSSADGELEDVQLAVRGAPIFFCPTSTTRRLPTGDELPRARADIKTACPDAAPSKATNDLSLGSFG